MRLKTAKRNRSQRFKGKYDASNPDYKIVCTNLLRQTKHKVTELSQQVKYCKNESATAKDAIEDRTGHITTKQDGKTYKSEIRQASYHLQSLGVSQPNVSPAIRLVVKTVTGAEVEGPLPSYSMNNNMCKEMKVVARQQIAEALTGQTDLTVKYDGITKTVGHGRANPFGRPQPTRRWDCS